MSKQWMLPVNSWGQTMAEGESTKDYSDRDVWKRPLYSS